MNANTNDEITSLGNYVLTSLLWPLENATENEIISPIHFPIRWGFQHSLNKKQKKIETKKNLRQKNLRQKKIWDIKYSNKKKT